jgi:outer membrane protein assembly factor BamB
MKLNTDFKLQDAMISINPQVVKYRYRSNVSKKLGTENSPAIYKNYIYFVDNSGLMQCLDLNTMEPLWARYVTDDTDSSIAIEEENSKVSLYTACEVDGQGINGFSYIRKINALNGELLWERKIKSAYDPKTNGGALASPIVGKHDIAGLVIYNIARTGENKNGSKLVALDKKTGETIWAVNNNFYSWSSPVDVYTSDGKSYIVFCDSGGYMYLLEGKSGKELDRIPLEANIEASPAVFEDMIVVGTRGQKIWGIRIK